MRIEESTDIILQNDENIELPASKWAPRRGDVLDEKVKEFEAKIDVKDADQTTGTEVRKKHPVHAIESYSTAQSRLLEEIRAATRELHRVRGDWDATSVDYRSWNEVRVPNKATAPLANPAYRDYADHIAGESIDPTTVATAPRRKEEAVGGAPINIEDRIAAYRAALLRTAEAHLK